MTYTVHEPIRDGQPFPTALWTFRTRAEAQKAATEALRTNRGTLYPVLDVRTSFLLLDRYVLRGSTPRHVFAHRQRERSS